MRAASVHALTHHHIQTHPHTHTPTHTYPHTTVKSLLEEGFVPSWCTACYRKGRTGEAFMKIAKSGNIHNFCHPNSLLTLQEYLDDYGTDEV